MSKSMEFIPILFLPSARRSVSGYFGPTRWRQLIPARSPSLPPERLRGLVLARIAHIFLDLAGQNFGDPDGILDGIGGSFLALRSLRHDFSAICFTLSIYAGMGGMR
jgi:hypothetical protein